MFDSELFQFHRNQSSGGNSEKQLRKNTSEGHCLSNSGGGLRVKYFNLVDFRKAIKYYQLFLSVTKEVLKNKHDEGNSCFSILRTLILVFSKEQ